MKLIQCILRPETIDDVVQRLDSVINGMTTRDVRGFGRQKGHKLHYRGVEYEVTLLPKLAIEILSDESWVDDVIRIVMECTRTGEIGDGRIFVFPVESSYTIRTGFMDM